MQNIDLTIFGVKMNVSTEVPNEMKQRAGELDKELCLLASQHPGAKPNLILTVACLKIMEDCEKLRKENALLTEEREKLNKALRSACL